jgi:glycosyltransferase involved in cell wall biosynthesis
MTSARGRIILLYDRAAPQIGGMERKIGEVGQILGRTHDVVILAEYQKHLERVLQLGDIQVLRYRITEQARIRSVIAAAEMVLGFGYTPYSLRALFTIAAGYQVLKANVPLMWCPTFYPAPFPVARSSRAQMKLTRLGRRAVRTALCHSYHALFRRCRVLLALTEEERRHWISEVGVPVQLVPDGVSAGHSRCVRRDVARSAIERRYGPGPHVLTIGRITAQKNQEVVVRAMPLLRARVPGAHLLVVGPPEGETAANLQKLVQSSGHADGVTFTGPVGDAELCQLYSGVTCVVHPSWHEASGLVPLEALAHGTPVIHSGLGALHRYASLPGCRTVLRSAEPESWADAIAEVIADAAQWEREATLGRNVVLSQHTWERTAQVVSLHAHQVSRNREVTFCGSTQDVPQFQTNPSHQSSE